MFLEKLDNCPACETPLRGFEYEMQCCAECGWMGGAAAGGEWRVGTKVTLNVYEGDRPVCQCHSTSDAQRIVAAMNSARKLRERIRELEEIAKRHIDLREGGIKNTP